MLNRKKHHSFLVSKSDIKFFFFLLLLLLLLFFARGSNLHDVPIYKRHDRQKPERLIGIEINKEKGDCLKPPRADFQRYNLPTSLPLLKKSHIRLGERRREGKAESRGRNKVFFFPLLPVLVFFFAVHKVARVTSWGHKKNKERGRQTGTEREFLRSVVKRIEAPN